MRPGFATFSGRLVDWIQPEYVRVIWRPDFAADSVGAQQEGRVLRMLLHGHRLLWVVVAAERLLALFAFYV